MCLVHGLADGRWLIDDGLVSDDLLVDRIVTLGLNGGPVLSKLHTVAPSELDQIELWSEGEA
jgi:hypothetical protein